MVVERRAGGGRIQQMSLKHYKCYVQILIIIGDP